MTTILRSSASPKAELESSVRKSFMAVSKIDGKSSKSCHTTAGSSCHTPRDTWEAGESVAVRFRYAEAKKQT